MNKFFSGFIAISIVLSFVVCVYFYGQDDNKVFSMRQYIENLATFSEIGSIQDVVECWTKDSYWSYEVVEEELEGGGFHATHKWVEYKFVSYTGDNDILIFFDWLLGFFKRLWRSIVVVVDIAVDVFANFDKLIPWNAAVEREVLFGV